MEKSELKQILEAAIMAAGCPLPIAHMEKLFEEMAEKKRPSKDDIKEALKELQEECETRGIELRDLSSGFQYRSKQEHAEFLKHLWEERAPRYSRALIETLALIAYKQPITRGAIEEVRGVAVSSQTVKTLLEREWVKVVGHKDVPGRPALYATTKGFLDYFNLKSLKELPPLQEMKDLAEAENKLKQQMELETEQENQQTVEIKLSEGEDGDDEDDSDIDTSVSVLEDDSLAEVFANVDSVNQSFSTDIPSSEESEESTEESVKTEESEKADEPAKAEDSVEVPEEPQQETSAEEVQQEQQEPQEEHVDAKQ